MAVASMYLFAVVLLLAYYLFKRTVSVLHRRQLTRDNRCKPLKALPQSEDIFGIGHTLKVIRNRAKKHFLDSVFEYFGDGFWTFSVTILGAPWIETIEAENVKYILSTKFEDFDIAPMRLRSFFPLMGAGIFTTDGAQWAHSRAVLRPSFNKSQLAEFELLETHTRNFLAHVPGDDSRIDLKPLCFCFTMDVSTDFLFGQSSFSLLAKSTGAEGDLDPISEAFNYSQQKIFTRTFLGPISTLFDAKFRRSNKIVHDFVDTFVRDALESHDSSMMKKNGRVEEGQFIFLKELVKDCQDPVQLRYHLVHILQAGRDTSACLIANTLFALANNPEVWAKLQEEVQTLKGKIPTYEDLKDMRYLKHVLQESLRLWPPVPTNVRMANKDTILPRGGGHDGESPVLVKKGTRVLYQPYGIHRREKYYGQDAQAFRPERWESLRVHWEYIPFNGGPRVCLGQNFALTEASYLILRLAQEFKALESCDSRPYLEGYTLTLVNDNGVNVRFRR